MFAPAADEHFRQSPCASCQQDIVGLGIECSVCPNHLRFCTECFGLGAEILLSSGSTHKSDHEYQFFESSGGISLFPTSSTNGRSSWTAKEHVRLLDSIEQYGFGNWYDISKFIDTKSPQDAKAEYVKRFVDGNLGRTWADVSKCERIQRPIDKTVPDFGPLSPSLTRKLPELEIGSDEVAQLGYMPKRDDYEKEYDNDAEKLVSQLVFNPEDEEAEVALKLALVDMYSRRLRERVRRKRVIRDYQLVAQFFKKDRPITAKRFQAYEKEMLEKYKPFAQFHTSLEHHHFIQNLVKEKELRFRLQELYKYRRNGVTRIQDCGEYEKFRARKSLKVGGLAATPTVEEENRTLLTKSLLQLSEMKSVPSNDVDDDDLFSAVKSPTAQPFLCDDISSNSVASPLDPPILRLPMESKSPEGSFLLKEDGQGDSDAQYTVDIENKPSAWLLTQHEIQLCQNLNLEPWDYIAYKTTLLQYPKRDCPITVSTQDWISIRKFLGDMKWI